VNFTTNVLTSVAKLFPSKYFSTGGDELNEACYAADAQTQQTLNSTGETLEQALSTFTVSNHKALSGLGKTPVVWEGSLFDSFISGNQCL
jgi:hexosaminidase